MSKVSDKLFEAAFEQFIGSIRGIKVDKDEYKGNLQSFIDELHTEIEALGLDDDDKGDEG